MFVCVCVCVGVHPSIPPALSHGEDQNCFKAKPADDGMEWRGVCIIILISPC